jgi:nitronate monooxygenase
MTSRATRLRDLLGIELPVIQAPMAGVQNHALAIAVSNAGALGSLPCAMFAPDAMEREIAVLASGTPHAYLVNFFCHAQPLADAELERRWRDLLAPYYAELGLELSDTDPGSARRPFDHDAADVLEGFRPAAVSFHFGLPSDELVARVRRMGSKVFSSATTVEEAKWLEARGVDAIVVQGAEAGGHRGMFLSDDVATQSPMRALLAAVLSGVRVPVIAAGGIADADDVAAVLAAGACAAQVGTAYMLCPEATTSAVHRAALKSAEGRPTALTNVFTGRPARGIVNRLMRDLGALRDDVPAFPLASAALAPLRAEAEKRGSGDFSALWAGERFGRCQDGLPAADLTGRLVSRL